MEEGFFFQRTVLCVMGWVKIGLKSALHNHEGNGNSDVGVSRNAIPHDVAYADGGNVVVVVIHECDVHISVFHQISAPLC